MKHIILIFVLSLFISACSNTQTDIKLYSLSIPNPDDTYPDTINFNSLKKPVLQITPVKLAEYLNTRNIIIQSNRYQIINANHHLWAEDLSRGIEKYLLTKLTELNYKFTVSNGISYKNNIPEYYLKLEFSAFHVTNNSQVTSKGKYSIIDKHNNLLLEKPFSYILSLQKDGYIHSIEKLNTTLDMLASDITANQILN